MTFLTAVGLKPKSSVNDNMAQNAARRLVQKLERYEYNEAERILSNTTDEERERLIYGFATNNKSVPLSAQWTKNHPRSALANTVLGASLIVTGWKIRGSSYAENVDASAWKPFLDSLKNSEEPLYTAAKLDQTSADPYSWLIHAGLGQGAPQEDLHSLFTEAISRQPLHWPSYYKYFNATTEKWGGSHKKMFTFVHESAKRAPRGNIIHSLVPAAYNDYALALGRESYKKLRRKENAINVAVSLYSWLDTKSDGLNDKLMRLSGGFSTYALNQYAVACYMCGAINEAKEVIDALRGEIESTPWIWISKGIRERVNPAFVYDRVCRELGVPNN
jgi:hypothetical protein